MNFSIQWIDEKMAPLRGIGGCEEATERVD